MNKTQEWNSRACQGWDSGERRYRVIDRSYTPEQSNILCRRGIILSDIIRKAGINKDF